MSEETKEENDVVVDNSIRASRTFEDRVPAEGGSGRNPRVVQERLETSTNHALNRHGNEDRVIDRNGWPPRRDNGWREELERGWAAYNQLQDPWWIYQQDPWTIAQYEHYLSNSEEKKFESGW